MFYITCHRPTFTNEFTLSFYVHETARSDTTYGALTNYTPLHTMSLNGKLGSTYFIRCMVLGPRVPACVTRHEEFTIDQIVVQSIILTTEKRVPMSAMFGYIEGKYSNFRTTDMPWRRQVAETLMSPYSFFVEVEQAQHGTEALWSIPRPWEPLWFHFAFTKRTPVPKHPPVLLSPLQVETEDALLSIWYRMSDSQQKPYVVGALIEDLTEQANLQAPLSTSSASALHLQLAHVPPVLEIDMHRCINGARWYSRMLSSTDQHGELHEAVEDLDKEVDYVLGRTDNPLQSFSQSVDGFSRSVGGCYPSA